MKKLVAIVALGAILVGFLPAPAHAHGGAALALAAFAAFNVLLFPFALAAAYAPPPVVYSTPVVYTTPAPTYATAPSVAAAQPAAPAMSRQVVYPHGRYLLYGDGVTRAYQWVWIPNPPPPGSAPGY